MEIFYESKYISIKFDSKAGILLSYWTTQEYMTDNEYIATFKEYETCVMKCKPKGVLIDATKATYSISLETQEWINSRIYPIYAACGTKKIAVLASTNFITQLSLEQVMEEVEGQSFRTHFFDTENNAVAWLKT